MSSVSRFERVEAARGGGGAIRDGPLFPDAALAAGDALGAFAAAGAGAGGSLMSSSSDDVLSVLEAADSEARTSRGDAPFEKATAI